MSFHRFPSILIPNNAPMMVSGLALTTPGAITQQVPAGWTSLDVEAWGAGGAGGGNSSTGSFGAGGGGGGYSKKTYAVTPGQIFSGNIGAGSAGTSGTGTAGGNTTVDVLTANGGGGGVTNGGSGGAGGTASGGDVNTTGTAGTNGGAGGSLNGAAGGASPNGGAGGAGGTGNVGGAGGLGGTGGTPGGGGGGGGGRGLGSNTSGGTGAPGQIKFTKTPTLINLTGYTTISDFDVSTAPAFDGTTNQAQVSCALKNNVAAGTSNGYIGKTLGTPSAIHSAVSHGTNDKGYAFTGSPSGSTMTLSLYGKQGTAPASPTNGTLLGQISFTNQANESVGRTIASSDTTTVWDHVWVYLTQPDNANNGFAEILFYAP
jgi:hypothetical protein